MAIHTEVKKIYHFKRYMGILNRKVDQLEILFSKNIHFIAECSDPILRLQLMHSLSFQRKIEAEYKNAVYNSTCFKMLFKRHIYFYLVKINILQLFAEI